MYSSEIANLEMTPEKWADLNRSVSEKEYRRIVMDYQRREEERLPSCASTFGLCRNFAFGKCTNKGFCRFKRKTA